MREIFRGIKLNSEDVGSVHSIGVYIPRQSDLCAKVQNIPGAMLYTSLISNIKNNDNATTEGFANALANLIEGNNDLIITAVPSSKGSNSSHGITEIARSLAKKTGNIFVPLERTAAITPQREVSHQERVSQERKKELSEFKVNKSLIRGKRILLLDDVYTTGASITAAKEKLLDEGAELVVCVTLAKSANMENLQSETPFFSPSGNMLRDKLNSTENESLKKAVDGIEIILPNFEKSTVVEPSIPLEGALPSQPNRLSILEKGFKDVQKAGTSLNNISSDPISKKRKTREKSVNITPAFSSASTNESLTTSSNPVQAEPENEYKKKLRPGPGKNTDK